MRKRAVITGIGLLSPIGRSPEHFYRSALNGLCGVRRISKFDPGNYPSQIAGQFEFGEDLLPLTKSQRAEMPAIAQWSVWSAQQAAADAGLDLGKEDPYQVDVVVGVAAPGLEVFQQQAIDLMTNGASAARPITPILANPAAPAIQISAFLGTQGEVMNFTTGCASSACAIGYALRLVQHGESTCVITGGADEGSSPIFMGAFGNGAALSKRNQDPEHASRPFERDRDGYVLGDAACMLVVEEYERARKRGARIYCEVAGFGATSDATSPRKVGRSEEAGARALEKALRCAGRSAESIDYYCAHGSSSRWSDIRETRMVKRVFNNHASRLAISSIKSMTGHPLGAAGALQTAAASMAIHKQAVCPTINYDAPDPDCDLDYVPNHARDMRVRSAMVYALGQGGNNTALVLSAV